jgi:hypothetical protein
LLQAGDLSTVEPSVARTIRDIAAMPEVVALARECGLEPTVLVIGLIARSESLRNRTAARIAKAIFGNMPVGRIDSIAQALRIS